MTDTEWARVLGWAQYYGFTVSEWIRRRAKARRDPLTGKRAGKERVQPAG